MKIRKQLVSIVLILAFTGCTESQESPELKEETSKSQSLAAQSVSAAVPMQEVKKDYTLALQDMETNRLAGNKVKAGRVMGAPLPASPGVDAIAMSTPTWNTESYNAVNENGFINVGNDPLSTFSIDVDTASYSNIRRFINQGIMPPIGAVRIEEMINYFSYSYPQPSTKHPFSVTTEVGLCPWNDSHQLLRIGLKAKNIDMKELPPSNLVFLIDVSGSMSAQNKLPLLKQSMKLLVKQLGKDDRVSMVVYAGNDRIALEPTAGSEQQKIFTAIDTLGAGGSTHASSGIVTAYKLAEQVFMPKGNNRIILASDGDFNVGTTSRGELQNLIEEKRKSGIYLTVLGFGMGNYHDDTMEIMADKGNGNYGYIDNLLEAKKVLVKEMSGTLFALARDVKIQVEFNPAKVGAYRLIGYENRTLADENFNDDTKDAGEIGVGHTVTALYELIPAGSDDMPSVDPLKYQQVKSGTNAKTSNELMTIKLRYKPMQTNQSTLLSTVVREAAIDLNNTSNDFRFAASVAGYGMLLTGSELNGKIDYQQVLTLAKGAKGADVEGYRAEFIRLVEMTQLLPH
jgi:Ca-activated chloride channel family protein